MLLLPLLLLHSLRHQDRNSGRSAFRGALELVLRCKMMQHHGRLLLLVKSSGVVGQQGVVDWRRVRQMLGRLFAADVFQALEEEASLVGRNASASGRTMQLTAAEFGRQQRQIVFRPQRSNTWITVDGGLQQRGYI